MCVKLPPINLNSDPYSLHLTSIYTCGVTTTPRVHDGIMGLVLSGRDLIKTAKSHMKSTCQKLKSHVRLSISRVFRG